MAIGNFWEANELEEKVIQVLAEITYYDPDHHFGRPFLTAFNWRFF